MQWVHDDGAVTSSGAHHAMASTPGHTVRSVRFLDADGDRLATREVTPATKEQAGGALPGAAGVQSGK